MAAPATPKSSRSSARRTFRTQLQPLDRFYAAESYHQNYFERNANQPYCQTVIAPKVAKVRERYLARHKRG